MIKNYPTNMTTWWPESEQHTDDDIRWVARELNVFNREPTKADSKLYKMLLKPGLRAAWRCINTEDET